MNRASKLGEDIAAAGEILIAKEALDLIPQEAKIKSRELSVSISGLNITAYSVIV